MNNLEKRLRQVKNSVEIQGIAKNDISGCWKTQIETRRNQDMNW
jgi:hypothetical protein